MVQRSILAALIGAALASGCAPRHGAPADGTEKSEVDDVEAWRAKRYENLKKPGGWLSLVGLGWLHEGANRAGSDAGSDVVFPPAAPPTVGTILLEGDRIAFTPARGVAVSSTNGTPVTGTVTLKSDLDGEADPTKLTIGSLTFFPIWRNGRTGIRITDTTAPARKAFAGVDHFPVDAKWRIEAKWEPYDPPHHIEVPTAVPGVTTRYPVPGAAVFEIGGVTHRLEPVIEPRETDLFFIFADSTTGLVTYGGGRFLYAKPPQDGKIVLDFNKAYNPPCVFTPFATCPLPPEQNRLPIAVEAGEKKFAEH